MQHKFQAGNLYDGENLFLNFYCRRAFFSRVIVEERSHHQSGAGAKTVVSLASLARLIMDNAKFYKRADIRHQLESAGQLVRYLPPYSPQLNPIEEFWAVLKSKQSSLRPWPRDRVQLRAGASDLLRLFEHYDMTGFYRHKRRFLALASQCEPFLQRAPQFVQSASLEVLTGALICARDAYFCATRAERAFLDCN